MDRFSGCGIEPTEGSTQFTPVRHLPPHVLVRQINSASDLDTAVDLTGLGRGLGCGLLLTRIATIVAVAGASDRHRREEALSSLIRRNCLFAELR